MTAPAKLDWRDDAVPDRYLGLWRRLSIEFPDGSGDIETVVNWLQSRRYYVDLRVPRLPIETGGVETFSDLDAAALRAVASQEAFAGTLRWQGESCAWRRPIDFRPPRPSPDEGDMRRDRRVLVEQGRHVDYVEHWWLEAPPEAELRVWASNSERRIAVRLGTHFMIAEDRRPAAPEGDLVEQAVAARGDEGRLRALLDCEVSCGTIERERWTILRSTLPWREGQETSPPDESEAIEE